MKTDTEALAIEITVAVNHTLFVNGYAPLRQPVTGYVKTAILKVLEGEKESKSKTKKERDG